MDTHFAPFSARARAEHLASLTGETWDLLIIGGGITGAAAARDAAGRGLRVALVDAGDLARGTSSRSSRLIHGGIRYLETGNLRLVFEASAERRRLLGLASHLVHPLPFLFAVYRGEAVGLRKLQAGMWLYDALSLFRNISRHRMVSRAKMKDEEPGLRTDGLAGAALYYDASVDDARLTVANARGAHEAGAAVVPHAEVTGFLRDARGVTGARVRDCLAPGADTVDVRARVILNATGPWSDAVRTLADSGTKPRLRPTKGVHIQVRRDRIGNRHAITFRSPVDGRVMFVLPWGDFSYVGTTDTDYVGSPADVRADESDVKYLLDSANGIFPAARLTGADVISTWAGIRPLLAPDKAEGGLAASATSREHEIWRDRSGLLNIAGGKLTTYRVMAGQAVDAAAKLLKEAGVASGESPTAHLPLPGDPQEPWETFLARVVHEAVGAGLDAETGEHLARAYGEDAEALLAAVRADADAGRRLMAGHPYIWAEVDHAVTAEMALRVEDVLVRRLHLFYEAMDGGLAVAEEVGRRMARADGVGWSEAQIAAQVKSYREAVASTRGYGG